MLLMAKPGDVVRALFTFSDLSGAKIRPALVVSSEMFNTETRHVILAGITTRPTHERFDLALENWKEASLDFPSLVRTGRLMTVDIGLIKKIGTLTTKDMEKVKVLFKDLFF